MAFVNFLAVLLLVAPIESNDHPQDTESFVVALLPKPIYEKADVTWPISPPTTNDLQNIKVTIKNSGDVDDDVGLHTYFPDGVEMTSFTAFVDGVAYLAKKFGRKEAQRVLYEAMNLGQMAAVLSPQRLEDEYETQTIQTTENSVHIKGNKEITFNIEYKETLQDMIDSGVKVQNRAQVVFDFFGSTVENMVGEISSPNYPHPYPNSADIAWLVRVPNDNIVQLSIVDIDIEQCCDYLTIYDGGSIGGRVIASLAGKMAEQNNLMYLSSKSSMSLHLKSDCSKASSGFRAEVSVVGTLNGKSPAAAKSKFAISNFSSRETVKSSYPVNNGNCSETENLDTDVGTYYYISSPNYPNAYYDNIDCTWYVSLSSGYESVSIQIWALDLENGYDYLNIENAYSDMVASLTGTEYPTTPIIVQMGARITFTTDQSVTKSGFNLQYEVIDTPSCDETVTLYANTYYDDLMSMNYPDDYFNLLHCTWVIQSLDPDSVVEVYVADLAIEGADRLTFYDGPSQYFEQISFAFKNDSYIHTSNSHMYVMFNSDVVYTLRGFHLMYRSVARSPLVLPNYNGPSLENADLACYTGLTVDVDASTYTYILSPNYPEEYRSNLRCTWYIQTTNPGHGIHIEVNDVALNDYSDDLNIFESWDASSSTSVTSNNRRKLFYSSPQVKITFSTYMSWRSTGFLLLVKSVPIPSSVAGETLDVYSGQYYLSSPNFPKGYYNTLSYTWTVNSHDGDFIQLSVIDLALTIDDNVYIYSNAADYGSLVSMFEANSYQSPLYTTGSQLNIQFYPHYYSQSSVGFQFQYASVSNVANDGSVLQGNCSTINYVHESTGTIYSNGYPYKNNLHECWFFDVNYDSVSLSVWFYTELGHDYLNIFNGDRMIGYYSGVVQQTYIQRTLPASGLWIQFVTDGTNSNYGGFSINYSGV